MAGSRVKGITIQIGGDTTQLDKALSDTDKQIRKTQSSLKDVEKLLKLDPGNAELLAQKQRLLTQAVSETGQRLETMRSAAAQAKEQFDAGLISQEQLDAVNRELIDTEQGFDRARRALEDFNDSAGDGADQADGLRGVLNSLSEQAANITVGNVLASAVTAAAGAVTDFIGSLWSLDEATEEYRAAMGRLNTAFESAGQSAGTAQEAYLGFFRILGDTDTAVEASQLLAQLADNEADMAEWTRIAAGVYGTFGDSLPIEGLIEAANETAKTGQVTGALADALNWVGLSEDQFNDSLALMGSEGERARFIMEGLSAAYSEAADSFYENNEALIAGREAQAQMDASMGELGEAIANIKTQFLGAFGEPLAIILNAAAAGIRALGDVLSWLGERIQEVANFFRELFNVGGKWEGGKLTGSGASGSGTASMSLTARDIPHLASGAVTRANSPFLAVVGDAGEPEVVAPYSAIRRAAEDALGAAGDRSGPVQVNINYTGNLAQLMRMLSPHITVEQHRRGPQMTH